MVSEGDTIHCPWHLDVGEQHMDAWRMIQKHDQCRVGMLDFHHLKALVTQGFDNDERTSSSSSTTRTKVWSGIASNSPDINSQPGGGAPGCSPIIL
jgi:hypothetical protein